MQFLSSTGFTHLGIAICFLFPLSGNVILHSISFMSSTKIACLRIEKVLFNVTLAPLLNLAFYPLCDHWLRCVLNKLFC